MPRKKPWCKRARPTEPSIEMSIRTLASRHSFTLAIGNLILSLLPYLGWGVVAYLLISVLIVFQGGGLEIIEPLLAFLFLYSITAIAVTAIGFCLSWLGRRRLRAQLLGDRCQRCVFCMYELKGLTRTQVICPECGECAPRRECVRLWCTLFRSNPCKQGPKSSSQFP